MSVLVSILIPVYNRENLIEETVQSALVQTYQNIEIIVVDNKSTDNTWAVLQRLVLKDSRIKIFQNESNIGPVRNWKRCIDKASGEYGKILWSDDLIASEFLEKTIPFLEEAHVGFVFTKTEIFRDQTAERTFQYGIGNTGVYCSEKYINGVLFQGNYPVSPGCALFRLKDLKKNLLVDIPNKAKSNFAMHAIGNDLLIFLLTAHQYKNFAFVNEQLSFFRAHEGSISVQSNDGKLPLYYLLASAYFIENYRKDLVQKLNTQIWITIKRFRKGSKTYNLDQTQNFYLINQNNAISILYLVVKVLKKVIQKLGVI